jgi:hypothetical protein
MADTASATKSLETRMSASREAWRPLSSYKSNKPAVTSTHPQIKSKLVRYSGLERLLLVKKFYYLGCGDAGTEEISLHLVAL